MIQDENLYKDFILKRGVGSNDYVASSPVSYVSYLRTVSTLIGSDITPTTLRSGTYISSIVRKIEGKRSPKTIRNFCSAMRQYIAFVEAKGLMRSKFKASHIGVLRHSKPPFLCPFVREEHGQSLSYRKAFDGKKSHGCLR